MKKKYVLITAARNEAEFIGNTIESVIKQTILPEKWIIVNDNSIDETAEIVSQYCKQYNFIKLINKIDNVKRDFASKAFALKEAYQNVSELKFSYLGILDADITLPTNYYKNIISEFLLDKKIGIAGGIRYDKVNGKWELFKKQPHSVCGAAHFLRRECYDAVGGYPPLKHGCEDTYVEVMARKLGWKVKTFQKYSIYHHRKTGRATFGNWKYHINSAKSQYYLGYDPLYFGVTVIYRLFQKPYILGSLLRIYGFSAGFFSKEKKNISTDLIKYLRFEQRRRLKNLFIRA